MNAVDCQVHEFRLGELCRVFNELPEPNKNIILFILTHLLNIANYSDKNMMSLKNLCTLFGPTLMKLSPKDNLQVEDMNREINESMQQAQVLFYILQLHSEGRLINDPNETHNTQRQTDNQAGVQESQQLLENIAKLNLTNKSTPPPLPSKTDNNNNNLQNNPNTSNRQNQNSSAYAKISMQTAL